MNRDSYAAMLAAVQAFHAKHDLRGLGGEDAFYRVALMTEELGEIAACISKGKPKAKLAEECADLLILLVGTAISLEFALDEAFWTKIDKLESRRGKMIHGRIRVSEFREG